MLKQSLLNFLYSFYTVTTLEKSPFTDHQAHCIKHIFHTFIYELLCSATLGLSDYASLKPEPPTVIR